MKPTQATYQSFLDSIDPAKGLPLKENSQAIIEHFRPAQGAIPFFSPAFFLLDFATKKYIYVEAGFFSQMGYTANFFLETGLELYLSKWHPQDFEIINTRTFPDNFAFLKSLPLENYPDYIISYNYRLRDTAGDYVTVLQRFSYIPGISLAAPAGMVGCAFNINHFKNDMSIVHTIEKVVPTPDGNINELLLKKTYPVCDVPNNVALSKRETQILRLIAEGLSSKQMAARMHISINTINNHRKNMLAKMGCSSTSELMHYAVKHGLI